MSEIEAPAPAANPSGSVRDAVSSLAQSWADRGAELAPEKGARREREPEPQREPEPVVTRETPPAGDDDSTILDAGEQREAEPEPEPTPLERLDYDQIAHDYGIEKNDLMQLVKTKVKDQEGNETEVNLHALTQSYQRGAEIDRVSRELSEARQRFETESQARSKALDDSELYIHAIAQMADQQTKSQHEALAAQYASIDWQRLRNDNPAEWAARSTEFETARQAIDQRKVASEQQILTAAQKLQEHRNGERQRALQAGRERLPREIPEWADDEVLKREAPMVTQHLRDRGLSDEAIASISDPVEIAIARDAMLYRQGQAALKQAQANEGQKAPAPAKPGRQQSAGFRRQRQAQRAEKSAHDKLRASGKQADAAEALTARWSNK